MGVDYYWKNDKHKLIVYLGRHINVMDFDPDVLTKIKQIIDSKDDSQSLPDRLFEALRERKITELTINDVSAVLQAAKLFNEICLLGDGQLEVFILDSLFGTGEVITGNQVDEYDDYKTIDEEYI